MGVADALAGLMEPEPPKRAGAEIVGRSGVEASGRSDVQTAKRLNVSTAERVDAWASKAADARRSDAQASGRSGVAKSQNANYAKKTLYILKSTMQDAFRKYQDAGGKEESELVEMLLREYVAGGRRG